MSRMMTLLQRQGQCVSCGRQPPWPHVAECPYCGEAVLMPRAWGVMRRVWLALLTTSLGLVAVLPAIQGVSYRAPGGASVPRWIFFSFALLFFVMPQDDRDVIVCSQRELLEWQAKSVLGSLLVGVASLVCIAAMADARLHGWGVLLGCVALLCLMAAPGFFRLCAWRLWAGMFLLAGALHLC